MRPIFWMLAGVGLYAFLKRKQPEVAAKVIEKAEKATEIVEKAIQQPGKLLQFPQLKKDIQAINPGDILEAVQSSTDYIAKSSSLLGVRVNLEGLADPIMVIETAGLV